MTLQKVKAVLFDLDGTLLDTVNDIGAGINVSLRRYGLPEHPFRDYRAFVGCGIRELFGQTVPEGLDQKTFEAALQYHLAYYPEHCTELTEPFPGVPELLEALQSRGYRLGMISNKLETTARKVMDCYFPGIRFEFIWGENGRRPLKPEVAAGALACETLDLRPEEILFFGDGDTDMRFGSTCGFRTVGCSWGYRSADCLRGCGAETVVDSTAELLSLLGIES